MKTLRPLVLSAFASLFLLPTAAQAQRYVFDELADEVSGTGLRFESRNEENKPTLVGINARTREVLCEVTLPSSTMNRVAHATSLEVLAELPSEGVVFGHIRLERGDIFETTHELVVRADVDGESCAFIWQETVSDASAGDRIIAWPPQAPETVALVLHTSAIPTCGPEPLHVRPRVYDVERERFIATSFRPTVRSDAQRIAGVSGAQVDRFARDARFNFASSTATDPEHAAPGATPVSIQDGDLTTFWREGDEGRGDGVFLGGALSAPVPIVGITLAGHPAAHTQVRRWLLRTDNADYLLDAPGEARVTYSLPAPDASRCFALFALELADDAETVTLAEAHVLTTLDTQEVHAAIDTLHSLSSEGEMMSAQAAGVLGSANESTLRVVAAGLPTAEFRDRQLSAEALAHSDAGRGELLELASRGELRERELQLAGQMLAREGRTGDFLFDALEAADPEVIDPLLILAIETVPASNADALLPWAGHPTPATILAPVDSSPDIAVGLARGGFSALNRYLEALDGRPGHDLEILRALLLIADETPATHIVVRPANADQIVALMADPNGTIARAATLLVGALNLRDARGALEEMALVEPHPQLRRAAIESLCSMESRFPDDADTQSFLRAGLDDRSPTVRIAAARCTQHLTMNDASVETLASSLRSEAWPDARRPLLTAIARSDAPSADTILAQYLRDATPQEVRSAMVAIMNRQRPISGALLRHIAEREDENEQTLVSVLRASAVAEGEEMVPWVTSHVDDASASLFVRTTALEALGRRRSEAGARAAATYLDDGEAELRRSAARALAYFPSTQVRFALTERRAVEDDAAVIAAIDASLRAIQQGLELRDRHEGR